MKTISIKSNLGPREGVRPKSGLGRALWNLINPCRCSSMCCHSSSGTCAGGCDGKCRSASREGALNLGDMLPGDECRVTAVHLDAGTETRLADRGIVAGVELRVQEKALFGGPMIVRVRGGMLALRRCEAHEIEVERVA